MYRIIRYGLLVVCLLAVLLASSTLLVAQVYTGSLTGLITDQSGGVIPGASVTLADKDKGFTYNATADSDGRYSLRNLPPGNYSLTVKSQGLRTANRTGIVLTV